MDKTDALCPLRRYILEDTCKAGKIAFVHSSHNVWENREHGILWCDMQNKAHWNNCTPGTCQTWRHLASQLHNVPKYEAQYQHTWKHLSPYEHLIHVVRRKWTAELFQSGWEDIWPQQCWKKSNPVLENLYQLSKDKLFLECFLQSGLQFSVRMGGYRPNVISLSLQWQGTEADKATLTGQEASWLNQSKKYISALKWKTISWDAEQNYGNLKVFLKHSLLSNLEVKTEETNPFKNSSNADFFPPLE